MAAKFRQPLKSHRWVIRSQQVVWNIEFRIMIRVASAKLES